ncbi:uncharacterized protein LOC131292861 [Anopheles ziemanni]|uniref:uncharacterized protein LOC131271206 n=1 Tax=Anopheles coustani TaxID=139045 RepID=UPI00265B54F9|nr:uncharacterized protein LOC131271206 [Anopheles coustani]XP_058176938.1 uncharacterized protein LOC131292861 [Anopheles ziemanni]
MAYKCRTHSPRSVDGEVPATDSNIINLSIKTSVPGQGFSAAKGRNLGFSNDPALNAIPVGINNELSNVEISRATPAVSVLRDSYGNPVTPFADLGSTESVGYFSNVNRGSDSNLAQVGQFNFKVPSYASGIIEHIGQPNSALQPPSPSTTAQKQVNSITTVLPPSTQHQFVPNAKIPTIEEGKILFAQKPVDGLLPPLFPEQLPPVYNIKVGTERSPIFFRDPFGIASSTASPLQSNGDDPASHIGFKTDVNKQTGFHQPGTVVQQSHQSNQQPPLIQKAAQAPLSSVKTKAVQKYTGGFGGAAGFLGNQQNIGTAYTSTQKSILQGVPVSPPPVFVPQNSFPSYTTVRPLDQTTTKKYSGSFGGPAGLLGSQQNLGTAYTKPPTFASIPVSTPGNLVPHNIATSQVSISTPGRPANPVLNAQSGSPVYGQQQQQQQQAQLARPVGPSLLNGSSKFTGSFGGAPGLLGSQQQPGTHVTPGGVILPPTASVGGYAAAQAPSVQQTLQQSFKPTGTGSKFAGTFGGPPGVLRPFDNAKA